MVASSEEKKSMTEVVSEDLNDVKPTLNNSAMKFFKKEPPTRKGEPLREQRWAFCCKTLLASRMFDICLFYTLSNC
jgi:hypothetical protein